MSRRSAWPSPVSGCCYPDGFRDGVHQRRFARGFRHRTFDLGNSSVACGLFSLNENASVFVSRQARASGSKRNHVHSIRNRQRTKLTLTDGRVLTPAAAGSDGIDGVDKIDCVDSECQCGQPTNRVNLVNNVRSQYRQHRQWGQCRPNPTRPPSADARTRSPGDAA